MLPAASVWLARCCDLLEGIERFAKERDKRMAKLRGAVEAASGK